MNDIKLAGMVTLFNPTDDDIKNMNSYINDVDILYVIDNTEGNDNQDRLPNNSKIRYFFKNENVGVAKALNIAAKEAIKDGFSYLLTMDQDSCFEGESLKQLKKDLITENMGKVGILVPWHKTKLKMEKASDKFDYPETTMTSGNILNLKIWQKVGGFLEWLFIDGIDIEYSLRIRKQGYIILRDNRVDLEHNLGDIQYKKFFGKEYVVDNHSALRRYYISRNNHYIFDMYKDFAPHICWSLVGAKYTYFAIIFYEKHKIKKIIAMRKGLKDYKNGIKGKCPYKF